MRPIVFELCAENIEACIAARDGGANRIELCSALNDGGMTPSHGLIREAIIRSGLPVHVLIRPRAGDFLYSAAEFEVMKEDIAYAKMLGASGVVFGILKSDRSVDVDRTRELGGLAQQLDVTFHRAFDHSASLDTALEDVVATGCHRILTSGGELDVMSGASSLAKLVKQANGRIEIAVGGGLRLGNAAEVAQITGARDFHGSLRRLATNPLAEIPSSQSLDGSIAMDGRLVVDSNDVRTIIRNLRGA